MGDNLLLITALLFQTQINTNYVRFKEKYVNFSDNFSFAVSKKVSNSFELMDSSDDMLVGNIETNNETIEYASVIKFPLNGYENLNITIANLTLYKKTGYGTSINVKTTTNFNLESSNPFSSFYYINSTNNAELYSESLTLDNEKWNNKYDSDILYFAIWRTYEYE